MSHPDKIPVVEIFGPTIMGEGVLIGTPTYFIRTASCDYKDVCKNCDSMHAVDPALYKGKARTMTSSEIVDELYSSKKDIVPWVTISGGNPALWDLSLLVDALHSQGALVCLETQGTVYKPWIPDCDLIYVAPKGPGMGANPDTSIFHFSTFMLSLRNGIMQQYGTTNHHSGPDVVIKVPIFTREDLDFAIQVQKVAQNYPIVLMVGNLIPEGKADYDNVLGCLIAQYNYVIDTVIQHYPGLVGCQILPQMHVMLWGNKQGV